MTLQQAAQLSQAWSGHRPEAELLLLTSRGRSIPRLVAKCFCVGGKDEIEKAFAGRNYGVGCKGGVEVVAHSLRDTLNKFKDSKYGLLKIDFRNAFNEASRPVCEVHLLDVSGNVKLD